jgi:hypothetical protein
VWLLVVLIGSTAAGCSSRHEPPVLEPLRQQQYRDPVILIPGITGSELRDLDSGKIVWGRGRNFFLPRDGGYRFVRPVINENEWRNDIEPINAMTELRVFGVIRVDVYASLIRMMEENGYQVGNLSDPQPGDTFFVFPYDLRYGNVEVAGLLAEQLERVRRVRGDAKMSVNLICHSNAAHIARYFSKYGGSSLEAAERGTARLPEGVRVDRVILVGTASGGTIIALQQLERGKSYVSWIGRKIRPEVMFTFRALFEALPVYSQDVFFDENGQPLEVDVFDAANWRRYGWSLFRPEVQRRMDAPENRALFGDAEQREQYLIDVLDYSQRLYAVLMEDSDAFDGTRYYLLHGINEKTPDGAVLVEGEDGWRTYFASDRRVTRDDRLEATVTAYGDGIATLGSQDYLSPQERAAVARSLGDIPTFHRKVIKHPEAQAAILEFLLDEAPPVGIEYARRAGAGARDGAGD